MKKSALTGIAILTAGIGLAACTPDQSSESNEYVKEFYNPILPDGADPWMTKHEDTYVYTHTTGSNITIWQSDSPTSMMNAESKVVWEPTPGTENSQNIWAPEVHFIDGKWYVYYAADGGGSQHRMYVLESENEDPFSEYTDVGQITDPTDKWGIDGTVIQQEEELFYVWSGWEGDENVSQYIYIAGMENPMELNTDRVELSRPEYDWEKEGGAPSINEGPQILYTEDYIHIVYSGSGSWSDFYKLGILTAERGSDLLDPDSWTKQEEPVFESGNNVYGPGHASFVESPDGSEQWIVYHAAKEQGSGWTRNVRMQPFEINEDGFPEFGEPVPVTKPLPLPAGDPVNITKYTAEEIETEADITEEGILAETDQNLSITFDAPEDGEYYLYLYWRNSGAVTVNGSTDSGDTFTLFNNNQGLQNEPLTASSYKLNLKQGENTIDLIVTNGTFDLDHIEIKDR
ncbi:family 43 glycosylhydrolase [Jeotgalibacillus haloalkalitolerans]|uniref:Family 43 glycosylhydrolase n=1 Tax=Jeotgalibacillus haloalkalitolerans TaxID=3104292 RepID=A0ABU5KIZ8_9BACL|nr:family 43 glycosylhydrolase [Jeotgalibacillus sp. HH7-29]MDZ5711230.1 family 43 glycosylhydrolase [Jeotgalibacillus sp. HH7-29]